MNPVCLVKWKPFPKPNHRSPLEQLVLFLDELLVLAQRRVARRQACVLAPVQAVFQHRPVRLVENAPLRSTVRSGRTPTMYRWNAA